MEPKNHKTGIGPYINTGRGIKIALAFMFAGGFTDIILAQFSPIFYWLSIALILIGFGSFLRIEIRVAIENRWNAEIDLLLRKQFSEPQLHLLSGRYNAGDRIDSKTFQKQHARSGPAKRQAVLGLSRDGIQLVDRYEGLTDVPWSCIRKITSRKPYINFLLGRIDRIVFIPNEFEGAVSLVHAEAPESLKFDN